MQLEITPMEYSPCKLLTFTINGKDADMDEFGQYCIYGEDPCFPIFTPYKTPDYNILKKYEISKDEYREVCEKLKRTITCS